jgi:hypothetical protein
VMVNDGGSLKPPTILCASSSGGRHTTSARPPGRSSVPGYRASTPSSCARPVGTRLRRVAMHSQIRRGAEPRDFEASARRRTDLVTTR